MFRSAHPLALLLLIALSACREAVLTARPEPEANAALAALSAAGLNPHKVAAGRDGFDVLVPASQLEEALSSLTIAGLPRTPEPGFSDLFAEPGLVPSPTEERVRYHHALAGELARTLRTLPGVLDARVHLALTPEPPPRLGRVAPAPVKASILLKAHPDAAAALETLRGEVRALVAGAVTTLDPEAVSVLIASAGGSAQAPIEATVTAAAPPEPPNAAPASVGADAPADSPTALATAPSVPQPAQPAAGLPTPRDSGAGAPHLRQVLLAAGGMAGLLGLLLTVLAVFRRDRAAPARGAT